DPNAFQYGIPFSVFSRRTHRHYAVGCPLELAAPRLLLRDCTLPLCAGGCDRLHGLCRNLLLVPQSNRPHDGREAWQMALLALLDWISRDLRHHALSWFRGYAPMDIHVSSRPRMGPLEPCGLHRRPDPGCRGAYLRLQPGLVTLQ